MEAPTYAPTIKFATTYAPTILTAAPTQDAIQDFFSQLTIWGHLNQDILSAVMLVLGVMVCCACTDHPNYKLFLFVFSVAAWGTNLAIGEWGDMIPHVSDLSGDLIGYVSLIVGAVVGMCVVQVWKGAFYLVGIVSGMVLGSFLYGAVVELSLAFLGNMPPWAKYVFIGVCALIMAFVMHKTGDLVLTTLWAFIGSFCIASSFAYFVKRATHSTGTWLDMSSFFFNLVGEVKTKDDFLNRCNEWCMVSLGLWVVSFLFAMRKQICCRKKKNKGSQFKLPM